MSSLMVRSLAGDLPQLLLEANARYAAQEAGGPSSVRRVPVPRGEDGGEEVWQDGGKATRGFLDARRFRRFMSWLMFPDAPGRKGGKRGGGKGGGKPGVGTNLLEQWVEMCGEQGRAARGDVAEGRGGCGAAEAWGAGAGSVDDGGHRGVDTESGDVAQLSSSVSNGSDNHERARLLRSGDVARLLLLLHHPCMPCKRGGSRRMRRAAQVCQKSPI